MFPFQAKVPRQREEIDQAWAKGCGREELLLLLQQSRAIQAKIDFAAQRINATAQRYFEAFCAPRTNIIGPQIQQRYCTIGFGNPVREKALIIQQLCCGQRPDSIIYGNRPVIE